MYKKVVIILLSIFIVNIMLNIPYESAFVYKKLIPKSRVVIIDAGHGGIDGGAVGKGGTVEKDINLAIAKKLKAYIEESGGVAIMIREVDEGLYKSEGSVRNKKNDDLRSRKEIIKQEAADIFISIHLNSFPISKYYGAQVFYQVGNEESKELAKYIQGELVKNIDPNNKRVEKDSDCYYILKGNEIPSVIVECGFLSNPAEEMLLRDEKYQNKISWAIFLGINKYFDSNK